MKKHLISALLSFVLLPGLHGAEAGRPLPDTEPLTLTGDLSAQMVAGIDRFLMRELERSVSVRTNFWMRNFSSPEAYARSIQTNREGFARIIGAVETRSEPGLASPPELVGETGQFRIWSVRWRAFEQVFGEGLLLQPLEKPVGVVIAVPDADQTPEMLAGLVAGTAEDQQFARRFAAAGALVLIPVLTDRQDTCSGNATLKRFTNQPHREWIYRQAYQMGRHIIGYEVLKLRAALDWLQSNSGSGDLRLQTEGLNYGLAGYGEGGLIAFYTAALDERVKATLVSGYFESRQRVWEEPIYRNVFGLLREFGDAEIATLIAPRALLIEHSDAPRIAGPPPPRSGRQGAAPGKWATPAFYKVESEANRANALVRKLGWEIDLVYGNEGISVGPGSDYALSSLLKNLGANPVPAVTNSSTAFKASGSLPDPVARQERQVAELEKWTQTLLENSEKVRDAFFWEPLGDTPKDQWAGAVKRFQTNLWESVIGRLPDPNVPAKPRTRLWRETPGWRGYEVVLDVYADVFAWGILLIPKDLQPDEHRAVVVCQHGLEGVPEDVINTDTNAPAYRPYKGYASRLADRGYVVYAPHNPYRGGDGFRVLQRKANPLGKSLFSIILAQHQRTLQWLGGLSFVDARRIGFYGLSYGGKTAMRVPSLLEGYCLSICSADFNEWIRKNVTTASTYSYMFTGEYEMPEFNLGHTFNYAEMAGLIAPRPFMVERGHHDGVAPDDWVAYEYKKVRQLYDRLGMPEASEIEFFDGPHTINGVGTFRFLERHLGAPASGR